MRHSCLSPLANVYMQQYRSYLLFKMYDFVYAICTLNGVLYLSIRLKLPAIYYLAAVVTLTVRSVKVCDTSRLRLASSSVYGRS